MVPPNDDDRCAWREYAKYLEGEAKKSSVKMEEMAAKLEVLERAFARRAEKMRKLPKIPRPPKTKDEIQDQRTQQALLRAENVVTEEPEAIPVPEELKKCPACGGGAFREVGITKPSETWSYVPGHFRRTIHTRQVVSCRCGGCIVAAPAPHRWSENARYDASFVAHVVVSKCLVVTPLYRLEKSFARIGVPMARSTMNDLFRRCGQKLLRLHEPLLAALRADPVVNVDETSFVLTSQASKAFVWTIVGRALTGYIFAPTRGGEVPREALGDSAGVLVCDDYRGYDPVAREGNRIRAGCMAHARRKYFEAGDVPEARRALDLIAAMYAVEHEAERREITGSEAHLALRRAYTLPLFLELVKLARALHREHGPKTLLGRAARYTRSNIHELSRAMYDARIPLDNNRAENALRLVALGRKNFLFVHSEAAGKELALLYSLVVSCTRVGVNPVEYLTGVLDRIDLTNDDSLRDLLPDRWRPPSAPRQDDATLF